MTAWWVYLEAHDHNGALYVYQFQVPDGEYGANAPDEAVDWVLTKYVSVHDGRRFLEAGGRIVRAHACHSEHLVSFELRPIEQPEYERLP